MDFLYQELFMFLGMKEFKVTLLVKVMTKPKEVVLPFCSCSHSLSCAGNQEQGK